MMQQILFFQGGGKGAYEADLKLVASLQEALGVDYEVVYPRMPAEESPEYDAWKTQVSKELTTLNDSGILVGHSLGGSVLLKYLSEEHITTPITGIFLIAVPYWGAEDWEVEEFILREDFTSQLPQVPIFLYHSLDDEIVPFAHLTIYTEKLPQAAFREFDGRGHQFRNDLSDVAVDIARLKALQRF